MPMFCNEYISSEYSLFWKEHNNEYFQRKELYVKTKLADKECKENEDAPSTLTPSEMSVFYRKFLNENYHKNL
jgi:hypothetical protein